MLSQYRAQSLPWRHSHTFRHWVWVLAGPPQARICAWSLFWLCAHAAVPFTRKAHNTAAAACANIVFPLPRYCSREYSLAVREELDPFDKSGSERGIVSHIGLSHFAIGAAGLWAVQFLGTWRPICCSFSWSGRTIDGKSSRPSS